jgi:hypothetical protein
MPSPAIATPRSASTSSTFDMEGSMSHVWQAIGRREAGRQDRATHAPEGQAQLDHGSAEG